MGSTTQNVALVYRKLLAGSKLVRSARIARLGPKGELFRCAYQLYHAMEIKDTPTGDGETAKMMYHYWVRQVANHYMNVRFDSESGRDKDECAMYALLTGY
jgi:hypothetical protein